jgi:hypothetical protein
MHLANYLGLLQPNGSSRSSTATARTPQRPDRLHSELFKGTRSGGLGLLRDLPGPVPDGHRVRHRLDEPRQLAWVLAGVVLLAAASWVRNRLTGVPVALRQA